MSCEELQSVASKQTKRKIQNTEHLINLIVGKKEGKNEETKKEDKQKTLSKMEEVSQI